MQPTRGEPDSGAAPSPGRYLLDPRRILPGVILGFLGLALLLAGGAYLIWKQQEADVLERIWADLAAVASAKSQEVGDWQGERINNAQTLLSQPFTRRTIDRLLAGEAVLREDRAALIASLSAMVARPRYESVYVVSADGSVVAEAGAPPVMPSAEVLQRVRESGTPQFEDFVLPDGGEDPVRLSLLVPVSGEERVTCILVLQINPYLHFYPLLSAWPTASPSAELLLVRRESANVIFLNKLLEPGVPLAVPLDTPGLVGAHGLVGGGFFTGRDYRMEPVLAATRGIPLSPWVLVAKVDQDEVFAPVRELALHITGVSLLLLLVAGAATATWWRKQQADFRALRYQAALRQEALTRHFDYLTKYASDIILLTDADGRILEANDRAVDVYGYGRSGLLGRPWKDLCGEFVTPLRESAAAVEPGLARLYEAEHQTADGSRIPVEISARAIPTEGAVYYQAIIRDITERRVAEERLRRLGNLYAALSQTNEAIVRVRNRDRLLQDVCRIAVEYGHFRVAWVGMRDEEQLRTAALYGTDSSDFRHRRLRLDPGVADGRGISATAVRDNVRQVSNDLSTIPAMASRQEVIRLGLRSAAALPLRQAGRPVGVLSVYSDAPDHFDAQILQLLDEMALDISFALDAFALDAIRRRSEQSLRESEFRFRQLFDNMSSGAAVYRYRPQSDDFIIADVNQALVRIERLGRSEIVGRPLLEVFPGADAMGLIGVLRRVWQSGERLHIEPTCYTDSRISGWRENWIYRLPSGEVVALYDDVTERVRAEQSLRTNEERLRLVLEGSRDGFWDLDFQAGQAYYSPRFAQMFGYKPDELGSGLDGWEQLVAPEDLRQVSDELEAHLRGETPQYKSEHRMRTKAGDVLWVLARGAVVHRDADGRPLRIAGTHTDITERKDYEERLRLWAKVFESSGEGIFITDAQHRIVQVNRAFTRITGWLPEEVIGRDPHFLSSGRHDHLFYEAIWDAIRKSGHWQGEIFDRRKDGEIFPEWLAISAVFDKHGELVNYVAMFSDISQRKEAEARIDFLARHDLLTGLPNRRLLLERMEQSIAHARRLGQRLAVLSIDVDHFKTVNDSLGHGVGDNLLVELGERLSSCTVTGDIVARGGGDEFIVVLVEIEEPTDAVRVAHCINGALATPFRLADNTDVRITVSIGISIYPEDGRDVDMLIRNSDAALYHAKERGRNNLQFFIPELNARARELLMLENNLRSAVDRGELILYYQPQVSMEGERLVGVEALLRWQRPGGLMLPAEFVPVAEDSGLIVGIGTWVLREACRQQRAWADEGILTMPVAINVSAVQFHHPGFSELLGEVMEEFGVDPRCIELEVTEGVVMRDVESAIHTLGRLKEMGVALAIDDFGTGYSSLNYLRRFPIDRLKVDQSFVRDMEVDAADRTITEAIIGLGKNLGLRVIAEGVETEAELSLLRERECEDVQGFIFGRPMPPGELAIWYREFEQQRRGRPH